jgi:hypothetical protein
MRFAMNSVHRVGVAIATIAAFVTVSGAVIVRSVTAGAPAQGVAGAPAISAPRIVYVAAARPAPVATPAPAATTAPPQIIYQVVAGYGDDDGGSDH